MIDIIPRNYFSHSLPYKTRFVNTLFENFLFFCNFFSFSIISTLFFGHFVLPYFFKCFPSMHILIDFPVKTLYNEKSQRRLL